ncbi:MAG: DeoR/GlpR family DNA-binding transcription regulator [Planctomycetota bacterium]|jgi:hypothetical protein
MVAKKGKKKKKPRKKGGFHKSLDLQKAIVLLSHLRDKHQIAISNIDNLLKSEGCKGSAPEKLKSIIKCLVDSSLPITKSGGSLLWVGPFENHAVGRRLHSCESKSLLAKKVIDLLISQSPSIHSVFIAAGSSSFCAAQELIQRRGEINTLADIYTNNVPALLELLPYGNLFKIRVPEGRIIMEDGTIISDNGIANFKKETFDAAIVSFLGMSFDKGFSSDGERDKNEKMMNLRPDNCSTIYIALGWEKFGTNEGEIVATVAEGIDLEKKYIIITNPSKNWENNEPDKLEEYKKWSDLTEKGVVEFKFVTE